MPKVKLSIVIDMESGEAKLSPKAIKFFNDCISTRPMLAADLLQDIGVENLQLYKRAQKAVSRLIKRAVEQAVSGADTPPEQEKPDA